MANTRCVHGCDKRQRSPEQEETRLDPLDGRIVRRKIADGFGDVVKARPERSRDDPAERCLYRPDDSGNQCR